MKTFQWFILPTAELLLSFVKYINQGLPTSKNPSNKSEAEAGCIWRFYKWDANVSTPQLNEGMDIILLSQCSPRLFI